MSGDAGASGSGSGSGGGGSGDGGRPSRYESQKRRDWNTFVNYLHNYSPAVGVGTCTGMHVVDFLRYLDQFGKTKVHVPACAFFGRPNPAGPCACPLRQAWGSLDALVGRLRAAFDEHSAAALANVHNNTNTTGNNNNNSNNNNNNSNNPFAARPVRQYLRDVRDLQSRARGISYHKKKRRNPIPAAPAAQAEQQQQQLQRQPHLHTRGYATAAAAAAAADEISSGSSSADVDAPAPAPAPPSATASYMMTMHGLR